jgi:hypothetical protein
MRIGSKRFLVSMLLGVVVLTIGFAYPQPRQPRIVQGPTFEYPSREVILRTLGSAEFVLNRWQDALKRWTNDDCDASAHQSRQCVNIALARSSIKLVTDTKLVSGASMHSISNCLLEAVSAADVLSSLPSRDAKQAERAETFHALSSELRDAQTIVYVLVEQYLLAEDDEVQRGRDKR